MSFTLRPFQEEAVEDLRHAAVEWIQAVGEVGPLRLGRQVVPLLAQLEAITGAGKTPILAAVIGGLGPSIVFWTTKSSILVGQTVAKLETVYRPFLPPGTRILSEIPSPIEWREMLADKTGTTIWVRTVASWNEPNGAAKGSEDARLNLHRPQPDWAGDRAPWATLADRSVRGRPLWVVYDEGHGQTGVQLDQLLDLRPEGIFAATATPVESDRFRQLRAVVEGDDVFRPIGRRAHVKVPTGAVAEAGLLKTTVHVTDLDLDDSTRLSAVVERVKALKVSADRAGRAVRPRALYIVERSNLPKGEKGDAPPVAIWSYLHRQAGVRADEIAMATDTKEAPAETERIEDFSSLRPRHRHVIFNKKLQEGWDDPEAYVAYFDGRTNSALRIKQLIGRVVRQPGGQHFPDKDLNSAFLFVSAPNEKFEAIVDALQQSLLDEYEGDEAGVPTITVETVKTARPPVIPRFDTAGLGLPTWTLISREMGQEFERLKTDGERPFKADALQAPGRALTMTFDLTAEDRVIQQAAVTMGANIKTKNRTYFQARVRALSRAAAARLESVNALAGEMYDQEASAFASAQQRMAESARQYVEEYQAHVQYRRAPDPDAPLWRPEGLALRAGEDLVAFERSVHAYYPRRSFNAEELEFARGLDGVSDGHWARNFDRAALNGYGLPLPVAVGSSHTFYPDFLWWVDGGCWAIDPTGPHIFDAKVRGKLLSLPEPRIALVAKGRLSADWQGREAPDGWTLARPSNAVQVRPEHFPNLEDLLSALRHGE